MEGLKQFLSSVENSNLYIDMTDGNNEGIPNYRLLADTCLSTSILPYFIDLLNVRRLNFTFCVLST